MDAPIVSDPVAPGRVCYPCDYGVQLCTDWETQVGIRTEFGLEREIEKFLKSVEKRAYRFAELSLRDRDDALDVVQDSMMQLVRAYADRPGTEWAPLFYQILRNRIRDTQRRRRTRNRWVAWWIGGARGDDEEPDPIDTAVSTDRSPDETLAQGQFIQALSAAVHTLSERQREVFLLRSLEGFDVAATARVIGCSEGSVKTHYFRALTQLREALGEHQI